MKLKITFITAILLALAPLAALASETNGTIVSGGNNGYAWSNQAGWVNFAPTNGGIQITDTGITGHAWNANYGWINMAPTNGGVLVAANGALSGYAWGASLGWINFSGVSINSSGKFIGQASGSIIGTLTFDCTNCSVVTDYRPSDFRSSTGGGGSGGGGGGSSSGGSTGGGRGVITQPTPTPTPVLPPSPELDTTTFPPGATPTDSAGDGVAGEDSLLPAQLFDIRLLLDRNEIPRIEDLVARVTFESFGRVPTPVEMTFTLLDADGNELWTSVDTTTVETSAVFVKRFISAPSLTPGSYTARLDTLYNTGVRDTFEAPFTVLSEEEATSYWILWLIGGILFVISLTLIFIWWRRGEDENKEANFP